MQKKMKYISLHYFVGLLLILALFFIVSFLFHRRNVSLFLFLIFLAGYLFLSRICNKQLMCEEGYSLIQAIYFYNACTQSKYGGTSSKKDINILQRTAERRDFLDTADPKKLVRCYEIGKQAEKTVTDPMVRFFWSLRTNK